MIMIEHRRDRSVIVVRVSGRLTATVYAQAIPELAHAFTLARDALRVLIRLEDFRGWEVGALWNELTLDLGQRGDLGRIAVLGETLLEKWATLLAAPFAAAAMRFFPAGHEAEARAWPDEGPSPPPGAA